MSENNNEENLPNFQNWFGKSKVQKSGKPQRVYHGTLANFDTFDLSKTNSDSFWGKGFYFTSDLKDVNTNYSSEKGPDYINRLERKVSNIIDNLKYEEEDREEIFTEEYLDSLNDKELEALYKDLALKALGTEHNGIVIPVYLSMQNPFTEKTQWSHNKDVVAIDTLKEAIEFLNSKKFQKTLSINGLSIDKYEREALGANLHEYVSCETNEGDTVEWTEFSRFLEDTANLDHDSIQFIVNALNNKFEDNVISEFEAPKTIITRFIEFISDNLPDDFYRPAQAMDKMKEIIFNYFEDEGYEEFTFKAFEFIDKLKSKSYDFYDVDDSQPSFIDLVSKFLVSEGYDGVIMDAKKHFEEMKMSSSTKHYICWNPNQIKSAIGNNGQYSKESENILYRIADKVNVNHKEMHLSEVKETILEFSSKMDNFIKFRIFDDVKEAQKFEYLPEDADLNTKGFFFESKEKGNFIGIVRKNIESRQDLLTTYVHEAVGHSSIKSILGDGYKPAMIKLFDFYNKKNHKEFNPQNDKFFNSEQKVKKAEEFLAVSIERKFNSGFSGIKLLVGQALNKIRKIFPELPITSFETDYIEKTAFDFYQKNEIKDVSIAQIVQEEIHGRNLILNVQRSPLNSNNRIHKK